MLTEHNKHDSDLAGSDLGLHEQELSCRRESQRLQSYTINSKMVTEHNKHGNDLADSDLMNKSSAATFYTLSTV